ncbi:MAG: ABC transporter substrate-binding protein [Desulfomonilaceae bacterium]|nr:ABC transporter substrate-binding protein [Desulfomonilaceae bacterium]
MRRDRIRWLLVWLAFALLGCVSPLTSAQAIAKEVAFLDLSDFTGPVAGLTVPASSGLEDYIKSVNEKGGVEGVKIKYIGVDTRYDVARTISAFKRYARDPQVVAMGICSTPAGKMLQRLTREQPIVCTVPGDGEFQAHLGNFFTWGPTYQDAFAATIDWVLKDWKEKGKEGDPSIAVLSWDNAYGREMLRGGKEYAEKKGVKVLKSELFPTGTLKYDIYLSRLAEAGANYVYVGGVDPTQTNIMRDATRLGLTKDIKFISDYWGPTALGTSLHPEALEGMVVVSFFLRGEDAQNNEMMKKFWTTYRKRPMKEMNGGYAIGLGLGMSLEAAIKDAIKRVGPDKLTRDEIYKSYQNITGLDRQGVVGPVAYAPKVRRASDVVKFYVVKSGKIIPITDWVEAPNAVALHKWE